MCAPTAVITGAKTLTATAAAESVLISQIMGLTIIVSILGYRIARILGLPELDILKNVKRKLMSVLGMLGR